MKKHWGAIGLIVVVGLWGVRAMFHPGLWTAHDIWHNVTRFYWYLEAFKAGQILPAWIPELANGYGYPLFIFSYHLPWLIGTPWAMLGLSLETALKLVYGLSFLVSGLTMYGMANRMFKSKSAAVTAAILYMWAPYHFLTLYVAAAAGIAWAYACLPLLFWGVWEIIANKQVSGVWIAALGLAGVALSHLILAMMVAPLAILWAGGLILIYGINKTRIKYGVMSVCLGLALAGFYLVPFGVYSPLIKANDLDLGFRSLYQTNFSSIKQLIYSPWGFGPIISNAKDGEISLQVGLAQWTAVGLGLLIIIIKRKKPDLVLVMAGMFGLTVFFISEYSKPLWDFVASYVVLDYPFRLLVMAVLFGSLIAGLVVDQVKPKLLMAVVFGVIALYTNRNHTRVNLYTQIPIQDYLEAEQTTNTYDEYLPLTADRSLLKKPKINAWVQWSFPGQTLLVDGRRTEYQTDEFGLIEFPESQAEITVKFRKPWPFWFGMALTISSIVYMVGLWKWTTKSQK